MSEPVDILIIGAGASGAAAAWSLAETKMRIVCLEQGGWVTPGDYPANGRDWEARATGDFSPSPNRRGRPEDYPVNDDASPIKILNFNGVGGGTIMYTAHWPRLHPSDFRTRTLDGVGADWPVSYAQLTPFYDLNDRMMGVSGLAGDPAYPAGKTPQMPPHALGRSGAVWGEAFNKLGWHWWPSDNTAATEEYEGRAKCINLAHCTPGCAQGAKAAADRGGDESAGLALVAERGGDRDAGVGGAGGVHQYWPLHPGLRAGGEGVDRHHLLAAGDPGGGGTADPLPGQAHHHRR